MSIRPPQIQEHIKDNDGREPTRIFLTQEDERWLAAMSINEAGGEVSTDVREQWKTIDAKDVVWDAKCRHCE